MPDKPVPSLLWSHHLPDEHHHCLQVRGRLICRRCLSLWPLTLVVMVASLAWNLPPSRLDRWLPILALPAIVEFVLERLRIVPYRPHRVILGSFLLAIPLGRGFSRYLKDPLDPWFWWLILLGGVPTTLSILWRHWRD